MAYDWRRSRDMPDFTRNGNDMGGGRLWWLLVVLAALGGLVLASTFVFSSLPAPPDGGVERIPAATAPGD